MSAPFDLHAGTTEFYLDPIYYDYEFKTRTGDVRWYGDRYVEAKELVLELGVGSGRIALKAVKRGAKVLGLDLSDDMLARAAVGRDALPEKRKANFQLVKGDMRRFAFGQRFGLISCPFNAFQHLYTREDVDACLSCVREHLTDDGLFAFDVLTPDMEYLTRAPLKIYEGVRFKHPVHGSHYTYSERTAYDVATQLNQMWLKFDRDPKATVGPPVIEIQLSHRCFFPAELSALLYYNGFEEVVRYGDFEGGLFGSDSESMIVICKKR